MRNVGLAEGLLLGLMVVEVLMGVGVGRSEGLYGGFCSSEGLDVVNNGRRILESFSSSNRAKLVA